MPCGRNGRRRSADGARLDEGQAMFPFSLGGKSFLFILDGDNDQDT